MKNSNIFKNLCEYISNNKFWNMISDDFGSNISLNTNQVIWFDKITYGINSDVSNWYTDTFFDTYKYWFFPEGI